jgi:hypothetical protein
MQAARPTQSCRLVAALFHKKENNIMRFIAIAFCLLALVAASAAVVDRNLPDSPSDIKVIDGRSFMYVTFRAVEGEWLELKANDDSPVRLTYRTERGELIRLHDDGFLTKR